MITGAHDNDLARVLAETGPVLLDFDGPICQVYPGGLNIRAADELRARLREHGIDSPGSIAAEKDPLAVLRYAGTLPNRAVVEDVDRTLTGIEVAAIPDAPPTAGAEAFLHACAEAGRPTVIVSNNASEAIEVYLRLHGLATLVAGVVGRPHACPAEMKPHRRSVEAALRDVGHEGHHCVLVGDSVTDVQVSKAVGLRSIAYVKAPDRLEQLAAQKPDALTSSMFQLANAVRVTGRTTP